MAIVFPKSRIERFRVKGTANATADTAQMTGIANAMYAAPTKSYVVEVNGSCYLDNIIQIRNAKFAWDFRPGGEFVRTNNLGIFQVSPHTGNGTADTNINILIHSPRTGHGTITPVDRDAFTLRNFSATVAKGDYVCIWNNVPLKLPHVSPHATSVRYVPVELHKLSRVVRGSSPTAYLFKDFLYDSYNSAQCYYRRIEMLKGVRWNGFRARALPGVFTGSNAYFLNFRAMADLEMLDNDYACNDGLPAGTVHAAICYDVRRSNLRMGDTESPNDLNTSPYGIIDGLGNRYFLESSELGDMRHCYTSGGQDVADTWITKYYNVGEIIRNSTVGRHYEVTVAGTSTTIPSHTTLGTQVYDGAVTWLDLGAGSPITILTYGTLKNALIVNNMGTLNARQTQAEGYQVWTAKTYTFGDVVRTGDGSFNGTNRGYVMSGGVGTSTTAPNHTTGAAQAYTTSGNSITWTDLGINGQGPMYVGQSVYDTHSDAVEVHFINNEARALAESPTTGPNIAITMRGRDCSATGNKIHCHKDAIPLRMGGPHNKFDNNDVYGGLRCEIGNSVGYNADVYGQTVSNNRFYDMTGPAVWVVGGGADLYITNNYFENCGQAQPTIDNFSPAGIIHIASLGANGKVYIQGNKGHRGLAQGTTQLMAQLGIVFGPGITVDHIGQLDNNNFTGFFSPFNAGFRARAWRAGMSLVVGDYVWHNGNEYRATADHTTSVAPVHTSGTTNNFYYRRAVPMALILDCEARFARFNNVAPSILLNKAAHGFDYDDLWKPLDQDINIYDDTDPASVYNGLILADIVDINNVRAITRGMEFIAPSGIISGSYSITDGDRGELYFDISLSGIGGYKATRPATSDPGAPPILKVTSYMSGASGYVHGVVI